MTISRDEFNKVNEPTFQRCLEAVKRVLADAGRDKSLVNEIVLVGGSTQVPRVQEILTEYFDGKPLNKSVHQTEAVAYGAAVQGAILAGVRDKQTSKVLLMDVVPLSLGVECEGRHFAKVVNRNTSIRAKKSSSPRCTTTKRKSTSESSRVNACPRTVTTYWASSKSPASKKPNKVCRKSTLLSKSTPTVC